MRFIFVCGFLMISSSAFSADECVALTDDKKRLACYDMKYKPIDKIERVGRWIVSNEVSKVDDSQAVYLQVVSNESIEKRAGGSDTATLTLRCQERETSLLINLAGEFLADISGYGDVTYRIDNQKAETRAFTASTNNQSLGLWSGKKAIPMIKSLLDHDVMLVRATPYNQSPETVTFPITGLKGVIEPLRKACGW